MKKLLIILCFIPYESTALTCPEGSFLLTDDRYYVDCDETCNTDGYTKITDEVLITAFEVTPCTDAAGTGTVTCTQ